MATDKVWSGPWSTRDIARQKKQEAEPKYPLCVFMVRKKGSAWVVYYKMKRVGKKKR